MTTDRTAAERNRRLNARRKAAGLVRVEVRVRREDAPAIRDLAQRLNACHSSRLPLVGGL